MEKFKDEIDEYSFILIQNYFLNLSFGGYPRNMYSGTPDEILHAVLLDLCECIDEDVKLTFNASAMDMMSHMIVGIYEESQYQSE